MPRSSRKRRGSSPKPSGQDVEMMDAENSPDPTQPSPSKRPRQQQQHQKQKQGNRARSRSASPRKGRKKKPKPPKLKVKIKRFHGVASWSWNVGGAAQRAADGELEHDEEDDICGICQNPFEGVAPGMKYPGDDCPLERGPCNHCFHLQCVNRWLGTKKSCPICRADWPT